MIRDKNTHAFTAQLQENPFQPLIRGVFADYLEERGDMERSEQLRKGLIPLTGFDEMAVSCLASCNFAPATWDKRFTRDLAARAETKPPALTPKQYLWLWVLLRRYRKSVSVQRVKDEAEKRYNGYIALLDLDHLKPIDRRRSKKTYDLTTMFDEVPLP